ncbi:MAG: hypothetical protein DWB44_12550 [Chloroflexi bacterium]|nr:hypothetical protein [Chloroflexota bacterium]
MLRSAQLIWKQGIGMAARILVFVGAAAVVVGQAAAQDGIPDNCEHQGAHARRRYWTERAL